jgi:hypothetical protein
VTGFEIFFAQDSRTGATTTRAAETKRYKDDAIMLSGPNYATTASNDNNNNLFITAATND